MFTGLIEETGTVEKIAPTSVGIRLTVRASSGGRSLKLGDSLAVNGCCLTVVRQRRTRGYALLEFDLLEETWRRTNLPFTRPGAEVNLERALRADARLGGHFVTGHIDDLGQITRWERVGADWLLEVAAAPALLRPVIAKGSIAVDGISLTVATVTRKSFQVWIIPHTYAVTALRERAVGDAVNLETDLLGKYVEKLLGRSRRP